MSYSSSASSWENAVVAAVALTGDYDDLTNKPLLLEISPTYQLNPIISSIKHNLNYGDYKKYSIFGNKSYLNQYIIQTINVVDKIVDLRLNKIKGA